MKKGNKRKVEKVEREREKRLRAEKE